MLIKILLFNKKETFPKNVLRMLKTVINDFWGSCCNWVNIFQQFFFLVVYILKNINFPKIFHNFFFLVFLFLRCGFNKLIFIFTFIHNKPIFFTVHCTVYNLLLNFCFIKKIEYSINHNKFRFLNILLSSHFY